MHCVITLGRCGALGISADGTKIYIPGYTVPVVDTCGAGDAFSAGLVCSLLDGRSLMQACQLGNVLGAIVATQAGGTEPVNRQLIQQFLAESPERVVDSRFERFDIGNSHIQW